MTDLDILVNRLKKTVLKEATEAKEEAERKKNLGIEDDKVMVITYNNQLKKLRQLLIEYAQIVTGIGSTEHSNNSSTKYLLNKETGEVRAKKIADLKTKAEEKYNQILDCLNGKRGSVNNSRGVKGLEAELTRDYREEEVFKKGLAWKKISDDVKKVDPKNLSWEIEADADPKKFSYTKIDKYGHSGEYNKFPEVEKDKEGNPPDEKDLSKIDPRYKASLNRTVTTILLPIINIIGRHIGEHDTELKSLQKKIAYKINRKDWTAADAKELDKGYRRGISIELAKDLATKTGKETPEEISKKAQLLYKKAEENSLEPGKDKGTDKQESDWKKAVDSTGSSMEKERIRSGLAKDNLKGQKAKAVSFLGKDISRFVGKGGATGSTNVSAIRNSYHTPMLSIIDLLKELEATVKDPDEPLIIKVGTFPGGGGKDGYPVFIKTSGPAIEGQPEHNGYYAFGVIKKAYDLVLPQYSMMVPSAKLKIVKNASGDEKKEFRKALEAARDKESIQTEEIDSIISKIFGF